MKKEKDRSHLGIEDRVEIAARIGCVRRADCYLALSSAFSYNASKTRFVSKPRS